MAQYQCYVAQNSDDWTENVLNLSPLGAVHGETTIRGYYGIANIGGIILDQISYAHADVDTSAVGGRKIIKAGLNYDDTYTTSPRTTTWYTIEIGSAAYKAHDSAFAPVKEVPGSGFWTGSVLLNTTAIDAINGNSKTRVTFKVAKPPNTGNWRKWEIIAREHAGQANAVKLYIETAERRYRCTVR